MHARLNWSQIIAFAWLHPEVLEVMRKDPKATIAELAKGAEGKYPNVDYQTAAAATAIKEQTDEDPAESYRGYLPLPEPSGGLENLSQEKLAESLRNGISGILKFDENADLWAEELLAAWKDPEKLRAIRQDPLSNLRHAEELQNSTYGILPLPGRPRGFDKLEKEDLAECLGDRDNMNNLGGIFLLGS